MVKTEDFVESWWKRETSANGFWLWSEDAMYVMYGEVRIEVVDDAIVLWIRRSGNGRFRAMTFGGKVHEVVSAEGADLIRDERGVWWMRIIMPRSNKWSERIMWLERRDVGSLIHRSGFVKPAFVIRGLRGMMAIDTPIAVAWEDAVRRAANVLHEETHSEEQLKAWHEEVEGTEREAVAAYYGTIELLLANFLM
jgi:hypothetical protein